MGKQIKCNKAEFVSVTGTTLDYNGRKFFVEFSNTVTFHDTNWGGGTKCEYTAIDLKNGAMSTFNAPAPWVNPVEGKTIDLSADKAIIRHDIFCGHDMGLTVILNSVHQPKWLSSGG